MITIFSKYVTPQIKEINHPALIQEWKLNLDATDYEKNMNANMYKPSGKRKFNCVDNQKHWPASMKDKIQWFTFITIMEHTANKMQEDNGIISSLLKMFSMFEIILSFGDEDLDALFINGINCKIETGLDSETIFNWVYDEIVTKYVLNGMLHHVGM